MCGRTDTTVMKEGKPLTGDLSTIAFIEHSYLFKPLEEDLRNRMIAAAVLISFKSGDVIIREGDEHDMYFYLIKRGTVSISLSRDGVPVQLALLSRGAFFGEVVLFTEGKRTATVMAVENSEVIRFDGAVMKKAIESSPKLKNLLKMVLEGRARDTIKKTLG